MRRVNRIERREILNGWIKWALLPIIFFSALFFDAWLNIQIRYKDYELSRLSVERRALDAELDMARAREARLSGIEHLTVMAESLRLSPPTTQQFQAVAYREAPQRMPVTPLAAADINMVSPAVIDLAPSSTVAFAKNIPQERSAPLIAGSGVQMHLTPVVPPLVLDVAPPAVEDDELSILTVSDMLGKL